MAVAGSDALKVTPVAEVESGQSIEHTIASVDGTNGSPAALALSLAEGKAVLAIRRRCSGIATAFAKSAVNRADRP
jgi:uncharacterized protein (TIGR03382 family)